jgi:Secretion system C-terminal sorting domain
MNIFIRKWFWAATLLAANTSFAQNSLLISPGANLFIGDSASIVLQNMGFENNGVVTATANSRMTFTGDLPVIFIGGSSITSLGKLEVNRGSGIIRLANSINIQGHIRFLSGNIDLNGNSIVLGTDPNGQLIDENENSHIFGNTGFISKTAVLNAPSTINPGGLGLFITSAQNLGNSIIERYHHRINNQSIHRVFKINPANNSLLNASLQFQYLDAELNGLNESLLTAFTGNNGINWKNEGGTINTTTNLLTTNGLNELSFITLANSDAALPVVLSRFYIVCSGNKTILNWQTAQEVNSNHFEIEYSLDGLSYTNAGTVTAKGNSNTSTDYKFAAPDNRGKYYRLKMVDKDGHFAYSDIAAIDCGTTPILFNLYPNPCTDKIIIQLPVTYHNSTVTISAISGKTIYQQTIKPGNSRFTINVGALANGLYLLEWQSGSFNYSMKFIKQ